MTDNQLAHYGVLGMRWGRRKGSSGSQTRQESSDHSRAASIKKKHLSEMTNEEIQVLSSRLQLEKQYKDLTKAEISGGRKIVGDVMTNTSKQLLSMAVMSLATIAGKKLYQFAIETAKKKTAGG